MTITEIQLAGSGGKYEQPTMEPAGGTYLKTYADGQLRRAQPGKLDYADFDLYEDAAGGS